MQLPVPLIFPLLITVNNVDWTTRNLDFSQQINNPVLGLYRDFAPHVSDHGILFQWGHNTDWSLTGYPPQRWNRNTNAWETPPPSTWSNLPFVGTPYTGMGGPALWHTWSTNNDPCPDGFIAPFRFDIQVLISSDYQFLDMNTATAMGFGCHRYGGTLFGTCPVNNPNYPNRVFFPVVQSRCESGDVFWNPLAQYWVNMGWDNPLGVGHGWIMRVGDGSVALSDYPIIFGNSVRCVAK